jgi:plasmid stability protein
VDLNIRDFDEELGQLLKVEAARRGKTLKELVTEELREVVCGPGKTGRVERASGVQGVRSGVRDDTSDKGQSRSASSATVQRSHNRAQSQTGTVGSSVQEDRSVEGIEKEYVGPPHAPKCGCAVCRSKREGNF